MGSLTSRPSVPSQPQVVYVPQPVAATPAPAEDTTASDTPSAEEVASEARTQSLLDRERSRFGTVLTSFRGLLGLSDNNDTSQRKTLLGE